MGLRSAVAAGTGMADWHVGIVDAFRGSVLYQQLIAAQVVSQPSLDPPVQSMTPADIASRTPSK